MSVNSRSKGARGERMLRDLFIDAGFEARRGQQYRGGPDSPDVIVPDLDHLFHFESKFVEKFRPKEFMKQAKKDAGKKIPVVMMKRSRERFMALMDAEDLILLLQMFFKENENGSPEGLETGSDNG